MDTCPHCDAPRVAALECPRCGVVYAKAHAPALPVAAPLAPPGAEDEVLDRRLVALVPPLALVFARLVVATSMGHALARIFFTMWLHELGHAVAAWLCGYGAFPALWVTPVSSERMPLVSVALAAALGFGAWRLWRAQRFGWAAAAGAILLIQLALTLGLKRASAEALITFSGDAGCFVFGAALVATFFAGAGSRLVRDWLRWGFVVIGAFAFDDALATWWAARTDADAIPFGEIEGVGLSDPSKLVEVAGWTVHQLVSRYLVVAALSFVGLAIAYAARLARR